jgi:cytochrome b
MKEQILVWDIPTRVFHWLLAASFAGAFLTAESERWRDVHVMLGYTFAGLIAFRLVWGLIGTRYARFRSFLFRRAELLDYLRSLVRRSPRHYPGHNPAGSLVILLLLGLGIVTIGSGWATYNEVGGEWLEELHEATANAMLALVFVHIAGVVVSSLLHRENLVAAMVTGRKRGAPAQGIHRGHAWLALLLLVAVTTFWSWYPSAAVDVPRPNAERSMEHHRAG